MTRLAVLCIASGLAACTLFQPVGDPQLGIELTPRTVVDDTEVKVRVSGTAGNGSVGQGIVRVTSTAGSLRGSLSATLDSFGVALFTFTCDPRVEPSCQQPVEVSASWDVEGTLLRAATRLNANGVMVTVDAGPEPGPLSWFVTAVCAGPSPGSPPRCCTPGDPLPCASLVLEDRSEFTARFEQVDGGIRFERLRARASRSAFSTGCQTLPWGLELSDGGTEPFDTSARWGTVTDGGNWGFEGVATGAPSIVADAAQCQRWNAPGTEALFLRYDDLRLSRGTPEERHFGPDAGDPTPISVLLRRPN